MVIRRNPDSSERKPQLQFEAAVISPKFLWISSLGKSRKACSPANHAPHVTKSLSMQIESGEPMFVWR